MPVSFIQHRINSQILYFHAKPTGNIHLTSNNSFREKMSNNYSSYKHKLLLNDIEINPGPNQTITIGYTNIRSLFSDTDNTMLIEVQDCKFNDMIQEFIYINNCDIIFFNRNLVKR